MVQNQGHFRIFLDQVPLMKSWATAAAAASSIDGKGLFFFRLTFTWSFSVHKIVIELSVNVQLRSTPELTNMGGLNCEYVM